MFGLLSFEKTPTNNKNPTNPKPKKPRLKHLISPERQECDKCDKMSFFNQKFDTSETQIVAL